MLVLDKDKVVTELQDLIDNYLDDLDDEQVYRARVKVRYLIQDIERGYLNKDR